MAAKTKPPRRKIRPPTKAIKAEADGGSKLDAIVAALRTPKARRSPR